MARQHKDLHPKHRFSIEASPHFFATLDRLGPQLDTTSRAATIRIAVDLLDTLVKRLAAGQTMMFRLPDGQLQPVIITTLFPCMPRDQPLIPETTPE